ncbi:MAG: outer membrane beta-barrel protein [Polyangiaceae bacterium]
MVSKSTSARAAVSLLFGWAMFAPSSALAQTSSAAAPVPALPVPSSAPASAPGAAPAAAPAQNPACPPGSWFCAEAPSQPVAAPGQPVQPLEPLPNPAAPVVVAPAPPVVVYQAPPTVLVPQPRVKTPPAYVYVPRPATVRRREWGLNFRFDGSILGSNAAKNAGMLGFGMGLRYRPAPVVAIEGSVDWLGGTDYRGYDRSETAFSLDSKLFLNPQSSFQLYLLLGMGWSGARVSNDTQYETYYGTQYYSGRNVRNYGYFNGFAGGGAEWRLGRHFALNGDVRAFVRGRVDSRSAYDYEFVDPIRGGTNTSGGALFTLGMTFYF